MKRVCRDETHCLRFTLKERDRLAGSGGTGPETIPAVCVHEAGAFGSNDTLCTLAPVG